MIIENARVEEITSIKGNIFLLNVYSPSIASSSKPGQFCNIKVSECTSPLLRRPFSVCDVEGDNVYFMFNIMGEGTDILSKKSSGDVLNLLGPLGNGFNYDDDYETAVFVGGGIGMAPFPFLNRLITGSRDILTFVGGRNEKDIIDYGVDNVRIASDDGSAGFHGNVIELLMENKDMLNSNCKLFGCGPTPMLKALKEFAAENNLECEISTESVMACGFGICQGCPIEKTNADDSYLLICKDGPVFNAKDVVL